MASAVSQLLAARDAPRLCHSSIDTIVPQEGVGVYIVQTCPREWTDCILKYLLVKIQGADVFLSH
jgi:hypothetical protein